MDKDLDYQYYIDHINIQEALNYAGYRLNRRDGTRWPSYVRVDDHGQRVRGDKFLVSPSSNGKTCFQPGTQKSYNIISFIKGFPQLFPESLNSKTPADLVNNVCQAILNIPQEQRNQRFINTSRNAKPYDIRDYEIRRLDTENFKSYKVFFPYFKDRGIDITTQKAFAGHFVLAKKKTQNQENKGYWNLSFPLVVPGREGIVGMEERGKGCLDGKSGYKGKAEGSNGSEGLWVARPGNVPGNTAGHVPLKDARHVYWFESAYDAMAYYQLKAGRDRNLGNAVFVSTGGNVTVGQIRGMLSQTPGAAHHLCFDNDRAGWEFTSNFKLEHVQMLRLRLARTPENRAYMDSLFGATDLTQGDATLLPKDLRVKHDAWKAARDEYMAMQAGSLDPKGEKAVQYARQHSENLLEDFSVSLRRFLKVRESFPDGNPEVIRELPERGKDWNEQLLLERSEQEEDADREDRHTRRQYAGLDFDGDGEIEPEETAEIKDHTYRPRR
jgi:hypothetical protein